VSSSRFFPILESSTSQVYLKHLITAINDEHRHTSPAARSPGPSAPSSLAPGGEPESGTRGCQISSETHHSVYTNYNHDTCDTSDKDPRPAKRRKPRSTPAVTPPLHLRWSPPIVSPSTARPEIHDPQPQHRASRTSQSPSAAAEAVPVAEYQEWPF
jgi:hypothetical protein